MAGEQRRNIFRIFNRKTTKVKVDDKFTGQTLTEGPNEVKVVVPGPKVKGNWLPWSGAQWYPKVRRTCRCGKCDVCSRAIVRAEVKRARRCERNKIWYTQLIEESNDTDHRGTDEAVDEVSTREPGAGQPVTSDI